MRDFSQNIHYRSFKVANEPPRKRAKAMERMGFNGTIDELTRKNCVVLNTPEEVICVVKSEGGLHYPKKIINEAKEKHRDKKITLVGNDENIVALSQKTKTSAIYFENAY